MSAERGSLDLTLIAAVARNGVIGRDGDLPWRLREDLRRFKRLTMGHRLVMGRNTWDSIGRPLPGREMFVLSSSPTLILPDGIHRLQTLDQAFALVDNVPDNQETVFCIGGAQLYEAMLPHASELLITHVEADVPGNVLFPEVDWEGWDALETQTTDADEHNQYPTTFVRYRRRSDGQ